MHSTEGSDGHDPGAIRSSGLNPGVVAVLPVMGHYSTLPEPLAVISRMAKSAKALRLRASGRLYSCNTLLEGLAQDCQDVACALGPFIQKEHAMVRQRHVTGQRHLAAADQADVRVDVVGGAKRAGGDQGGAGAGEAGDAVDAGGFNGFGQGHLRQEGGAPAHQQRLAPARGPTMSRSSLPTA
jgi:hypothetical protein